jgi:DNA polymerase III subunit gamma/tau
MSYQVLARKYRPKSFENLVGQDHVVRALTNALDQQRLHHAYLFTGTRGVGKTTLARILAKSLNCEIGVTAKPCGVCDACTGIDADRFIDYIEINAASTRGIDDVRTLLEQATYAPTQGRFKIFMLDEVHQLTKEAFNALLKTLEEPPAHIKFILGTTDPQKVPVTVLSRCLQFNLRQMASPTISEHLKHVLAQEQISFEPAAIHLIARAAAGSMRDALSLTDQAIAYGNQSVNEAEVRSMLGAIDQSYLYEILSALQANNGAAVIEITKQMEARSLSFEAALNDLANLLHQVAIAQTVPQSIADDLPERAALLNLAQSLSAETVQLYYQIALLGRRDIGLAPDEYAGFTMTLLRMLAFTPTEKSALVPQVGDKLTKSVQQARPMPQADTKPLMSEPPAIEPPQVETTFLTDSQQSQELSPQNIPADTDDSYVKANIHQASSVPVSGTASFDGNWRKLVEQNLKLGLARALAQNCELVSYDEHSLNLRVASAQKHLISPSYQDKLANAINEYFGRKIRLSIAVASDTHKEILTPAKQNANEKAVIQSSAEAAIMNDDFVKALMHDLGATIIPNSIKPN